MGLFSSIWPVLMALDGVRNFRPVAEGLYYRSAALDAITEQGMETLLSPASTELHGRPLAAVIDLRNIDEISKGETGRTEAANVLYQTFGNSNRIARNGGIIENYIDSEEEGPRLYHAPLLDPDAFWDEAIERMPTGMRIQSTLRTAFEGGALDRAAARHLEDCGLGLLYTIMLATSGPQIGSVLKVCAEESKRGAVLFHCAKGKDRTGVVAMLLEAGYLGLDDNEMILNYAASGALLGGEDAKSPNERTRSDPTAKSTTIDWSRFRGSPELAMAETLEWIRSVHGSIDQYLDSVGVDSAYRETVRNGSNIKSTTN
mmetsp:Transcript_16626/g.23425  ORF Transcript_16626/g.23425 Transcript_16626/m.23425 type:complete len:316 (+) Transcript_16626:135-1082(+)